MEALPPLLSGLFVSAAVDQGFLAGRPGAGVAWLAGFGAAMAVRAYAARAGFPHLAGVVEPLRDALVERVVHSALARPSADPAELARLTEQVESARQLTATLLRTLRGVGVTLVAALAGLALLAPAVLPLVLLPLLAAGFLFFRLLRPLVARRRVVVLAEERLAAEAGRALHGLRDVQATGTREQVAEALTGAARASAAAARALGRASALRALVVALGGRLPVLAVLAAAPWLLAREALTPGELLGVATYLLQQLDPAVRTLAGTVGGWLLNLAVVLDRLAATTSDPPADAAPGALPGTAPGQEPEVRVSGLGYGHGGAGTPVLEGLEFGFGPGEHVAVVGVSGAGKSTLAALLAGVLAPTGGAVSVGGVRPDGLAGAARARLVALVPQEAYVFPGPVRSNLTWLSPEATEEQLARAVRLLGADRQVARHDLDRISSVPAVMVAGARAAITGCGAYRAPDRGPDRAPPSAGRAPMTCTLRTEKTISDVRHPHRHHRTHGQRDRRRREHRLGRLVARPAPGPVRRRRHARGRPARPAPRRGGPGLSTPAPGGPVGGSTPRRALVASWVR
ncbi:ATP-binding cassette domain-containing protein, partial [Kitasatospora sp. NPDC059800]|uniref:ATP-binding cassette domain-containing protein n=1 Tax=Kitasatospora sp. NPDC059800 TaxID=3346951 RepID=UPI00365F09A3